MFLDLSMSVKKTLQFSRSTKLKTELSSQLLLRSILYFECLGTFSYEF